jgi:hypothetical protein
MPQIQEIPQSLIDERAAEMLGRSFEAGVAFVRQARSHGVPFEALQRLAQKPNDPWWAHLDELVPKPEAALVPAQAATPWSPTDDERKVVSRFVESNLKFWRDVHGIDLRLPEDVYPLFPRLVPGFERYIVMPQIGLNAIWEGQSRSFKAWKYFDTEPEAFVTQNERSAAKTGLYVILVRESVEPDSDLLNLSASMVKKRKLKTETLAERLVHGHQYYIETKGHLDVNGWTICSGSRYSDGGVPYAYWRGADREVRVDWSGVDDRDPSSGPRAAVTL